MRPCGAGRSHAAASAKGDEFDYLDLCQAASGELVDLEGWSDSQEARERLIVDSHWIADSLESEGIRAKGDAKLALVGICSGQVVELPDFRNIVFIPVVAARKRGPMIKQLEYFLDRNRYSRMWVFTSGDRAKLSDVRGRIQHLHRRLSKLNNEPFMKTGGVEIVFRSTELGSVVRSHDGEASFHLHAHTIIRIARKLPKDDWKALLSAVHRWWKFHFEDSQRVQQAREVCKYVVKPQALRQLRPAELATLHRELFRLHLVQPMGALKEQIAAFEEKDLRLVRKRVGDSFRVIPVRNWNGPRRAKDEPETTPAPELKDYVVTTMIPAPYFGPITEPAALVLNPSGKDVGRFGRVWRARAAALEAYEKGKQANNGK